MQQQRKRKISVRRIIQTLVTLLVTSGCVVALLSADRIQDKKNLRAVDIRITNEGSVQFTDRAQIQEMLFSAKGSDPLHTPLSALNLRSMEEVLQHNPWISAAQVYADNDLVLHIRATQRIPVLRIFQTDGNSYYLDPALQVIPLSSHYAAYVPVVTGVLPEDNDSAALVIRKELMYLQQTISNSAFWSAQVAQLAVGEDGGYEIVPIAGGQRILVGDTARFPEKLDHLYAFYKKVQNQIGWDKYTTIDLRYAGQIVAAPALKWKAPVDRAATSMSWVKAIMENGEKDTANLPNDPAVRPTIPPVPTAAPHVHTTPAGVLPAARVSAQAVPQPAARRAPGAVITPHVMPSGQKPKPGAGAAQIKPKPLPVAASPKPKPRPGAANVTATKPKPPTAQPAAVKPKPIGPQP